MILKARFLLPLSRLSFGVYLVHLSVIYMKHYSTRQTFFWSDIAFLNSAIGTFCISVVLAYLLFVLFESPAVQLEKQIMRAQAGKRQTYKVQRSPNGSHNSSKSSSRSSFYCHCKEILKGQCSFAKADAELCKKRQTVTIRDDTNRKEQLKKLEEAAKAATGATILQSYYSKV